MIIVSGPAQVCCGCTEGNIGDERYFDEKATNNRIDIFLDSMRVKKPLRTHENNRPMGLYCVYPQAKGDY